MQNRYWIYICKEILYDKKGRSIHEIAKKREQTPQYWISLHGLHLVLHQFSSVSQSCPTLCDPTDCSIPGFPAHQQLLELAHTHAHPVSDAIQPSHPLPPPSPFAFNHSIHGTQWTPKEFSWLLGTLLLLLTSPEPLLTQQCHTTIRKGPTPFQLLLPWILYPLLCYEF